MVTMMAMVMMMMMVAKAQMSHKDQNQPARANIKAKGPKVLRMVQPALGCEQERSKMAINAR